MKRKIWGNMYPEDFEIFKQSVLENYEDDGLNPDDLTDRDLYDMMWDENHEWFECEQANLNIETQGEIVCIANLGLWDGHHMAYKLCGNKVKNCIYPLDGGQSSFFCDRYNLRGVEHHHDGTNTYLFRELKPDLSNAQRDNFLDKVYIGSATRQDITRYTRSLLPAISRVYGW